MRDKNTRQCLISGKTTSILISRVATVVYPVIWSYPLERSTGAWLPCRDFLESLLMRLYRRYIRVVRPLPTLAIVLLSFTLAALYARSARASPAEFQRITTAEPMVENKNNKTIRVAENSDGLALDVAIDAKKNQSYIKADDQFDSFVYSETLQNGTKVIRPASENIMGWWKGNRTLKEIPFSGKGYFETTDQFAPIFLVVDLTNNRAGPVQLRTPTSILIPAQPTCNLTSSWEAGIVSVVIMEGTIPNFHLIISGGARFTTPN
jgi:hypothetical protein